MPIVGRRKESLPGDFTLTVYGTRPGVLGVLRNSSPLAAGRLTITVLAAGDSIAGRGVPGKALKATAA